MGTGVDIVGEIQPGVPRLFVNSTLITQAITAVIMSAVRFTREGEGASARDASRPGSPTSSASISRALGAGCRATELEKVFDAFKYADRARRMGSLGLGLSLARSIVELHGGTLDVDEMTAGGVAFHVWLPTADTGTYTARMREQGRPV